jgi:hypothetical protein
LTKVAGYVVLADGVVWTATSIQTGEAVSDACPIRALTECRVMDRGKKAGQGTSPYVPDTRGIDVALAMVMTFLHLDMNDIAGPERFKPVVQRRAIAWYLLWHHGNGSTRVFSAPQIADACRRTNHSTIISAANRVLPLTVLPEWQQLLAAWRVGVRRNEVKDCTCEPWFVAICGVFGSNA